MAPTAAADAASASSSSVAAAALAGGADRRDADDLLSFSSPRAGESPARDEAAGSRDETAALLAFYRRRCDEFQDERRRTLERLAQIEVSKEEAHRLRWELRSRTSELEELQGALAAANAALLDAKRQRVDLEAENSALRLRERQDRAKIRHLLALTQPVAEHVVFARDCRPGARAAFPVRPPPTPQAFEYPSTMHIASERMRSAPTRRARARSTGASASALGSFGSWQSLGPGLSSADAVADLSRGRAARPASRVVPGAAVLRTVYMPDEQAGELAATVESLRAQLEAHRQLSDENARRLTEQFAEEKAALGRRRQELEAEVTRLEAQGTKAQRVLAQTTKDYLELRHRAQEKERRAREEAHGLGRQCAALQREREEAAQQAERERVAADEAAREEGGQAAESFRAQALARERDLRMLREQYAAVQAACAARIQDLQARLAKLRGRYRDLDRRRALEMEGFSRDVAALRRHLQRLEVMHYGRRLTAQERDALRLDDKYALSANELSGEIAALQRRIAELSADLAED